MAHRQRIVSLLPAATETLFALGLGDRVVGVSHECDYPPQAASLPRITRSCIHADASSAEIDRQTRERLLQGAPLFELDIQLLTALQPTLIVTQSHCAVCAVAEADVSRSIAGKPELRQVQVLALHPRTLNDVWDEIFRIAKATQSDAAARKLVTKLRSRVRHIEQHVAALRRKPRRVACLEWIDPPIVSGNWIPDLLRLAGGLGNGIQPGEPSRVTSWQSVMRFRPDVVILIPCGFSWERTYRELTQLDEAHPLRAQLLKQAEVYVADGHAYFNHTGPRLVDSLEILAQMLHPELVGVLTDYQHAWRKVVVLEDGVQLAIRSAGV